jgi:hypothetical protein
MVRGCGGAPSGRSAPSRLSPPSHPSPFRRGAGGEVALQPEGEILALLALLDRLCAMLTRLGRMGDSSGETTHPGQRGRERLPWAARVSVSGMRLAVRVPSIAHALAHGSPRSALSAARQPNTLTLTPTLAASRGPAIRAACNFPTDSDYSLWLLAARRARSTRFSREGLRGSRRRASL